jgi:hypothetical protein
MSFSGTSPSVSSHCQPRFLLEDTLNCDQYPRGVLAVPLSAPVSICIMRIPRRLFVDMCARTMKVACGYVCALEPAWLIVAIAVRQASVEDKHATSRSSQLLLSNHSWCVSESSQDGGRAWCWSDGDGFPRAKFCLSELGYPLRGAPALASAKSNASHLGMTSVLVTSSRRRRYADPSPHNDGSSPRVYAFV